MQNIELIIYIILIVIFTRQRFIISAKKNGCFYGKNKIPLPAKLKYAINNLHYLETPAWWMLSCIIFFSVLCINRMYFFNYEPIPILLQLLSSYLITMGISGSTSFQRQKWINIGSKLPINWDMEDNKTEFAWQMSKFITVQFWRNRYFSGGQQRRIIEIIGYISIIIGIILILITKYLYHGVIS